jgi:uncharacterized protein (DUF488 family)
MFYRKKLLLALLQTAGGRMEKLRLQKLLFLICVKLSKPTYHFVPYKFGCFSFQATADLHAMRKNNLIKELEKEWHLIDDGDFAVTLSEEDSKVMQDVTAAFGAMLTDDLIRYTYIHFPYYALNSTIVQKYLNQEQISAIAHTVSHDDTRTLFTIGYEGKSVEQFLNVLLKTNIKTLCDVRKNAYSMKYGFSKSTLANACEAVGIKYLHTPAFGIESAERKKLETEADYKALFSEYRNGVLARTTAEQKEILYIVYKDKRMALMCFEAVYSMCHRSYLANSILALDSSNLPLVHL